MNECHYCGTYHERTDDGDIECSQCFYNLEKCRATASITKAEYSDPHNFLQCICCSHIEHASIALTKICRLCGNTREMINEPPVEGPVFATGQKRLEKLAKLLKQYEGCDCKTRNFRQLHHLDILQRVKIACLRNGFTDYVSDVIRALLPWRTVLQIAHLLTKTNDKDADGPIMKLVSENVRFSAMMSRAAEAAAKTASPAADAGPASIPGPNINDFAYWCCTSWHKIWERSKTKSVVCHSCGHQYNRPPAGRSC